MIDRDFQVLLGGSCHLVRYINLVIGYRWINSNHPYLSKFIHTYPNLSISIQIYPYLSILTRTYPYSSMITYPYHTHHFSIFLTRLIIHSPLTEPPPVGAAHGRRHRRHRRHRASSRGSQRPPTRPSQHPWCPWRSAWRSVEGWVTKGSGGNKSMDQWMIINDCYICCCYMAKTWSQYYRIL